MTSSAASHRSFDASGLYVYPHAITVPLSTTDLATETPTVEACAWCGGELVGGIALTGRVRCPRCGVANTHPWPTEAELEAAYAAWYRPESGRFSGFGDALLKRTRGRLARRVDRVAPAGTVLDVGSGDGSLLDALVARGRDALGLEREATRPDVRVGDLGDVDGPFAAIVFWHALEHLPNPGREIERAAARLVPGGMLIVVVPNSSSLQARVFGDRWLALDLPRHLVHLPAEALMARLRGSALEIGRVSYWRGGQVVFGWLHGLVGALPGHPDLYGAIRRPEARPVRSSASRRLATLAAGTLLAPSAFAAAAVEIALRRGGTVYVEAYRA
jgi:SAM-dependent methyltransferase